MPITFGERERTYWKRLLVITPFATLGVIILFLTSDIVPPEVIDKTFGWRGALKVLPDITIIPDSDPFESFPLEKRTPPMTAINFESIDETNPGKIPQPEKIIPEKEEIQIPSEKDLSQIRTYESHTDVPYSEDYVILEMVQPEYPMHELMNGIEGDVTVELLVNDKGHVEKVWVLSAIGPYSFERSSLDAVEKFIFQPPIENGRPMSMWIRFHIKFRIFG